MADARSDGDDRVAVAGVEWTNAERAQLCSILKCESADLEKRLKKFAAAATEEILRMVLGQRVFTRGSDILEFRLLLLIQHVFDSELPTEAQVSALFQTTAGQSRSLLRAVMSKFQYELESAVSATIRANLAPEKVSVDASGETYTVVIESQPIVEAMNRRLGQASGVMQPLIRVKNTISQYSMPLSSYELLSGTSGGATDG